jgi:hypothetical protein
VESAKTGLPCTARAFDATTGALRWHQAFGPTEPLGACVARQLSVTPAGAVLSTTGRQGDVLYGFSLETGAQTFEREHPSYPSSWEPAWTGRITRDLALFVDYWTYPEGFDTVVVGIDPRTGRGAPLARVRQGAPTVLAEDADVSDTSWGPHSLLLAGSFYAGVALDDMVLTTSAVSYTRCQSIDPGFYIGPEPPPPPPRYEPGPWRAPRRRVCPELTFAERVHEYKTSLFVARLPLASFGAGAR